MTYGTEKRFNLFTRKKYTFWSVDNFTDNVIKTSVIAKIIIDGKCVSFRKHLFMIFNYHFGVSRTIYLTYIDKGFVI